MVFRLLDNERLCCWLLPKSRDLDDAMCCCDKPMSETVGERNQDRDDRDGRDGRMAVTCAEIKVGRICT